MGKITAAEIKEREEAKVRIVKTHGQAAINTARRRLCFDCRHSLRSQSCYFSLLPITLSGENCPYYERRLDP